MKSYEKDQKEFIAALKKILRDKYSEAVKQARAAKEGYLAGIENPTARDINLAGACANRVMLQHASAFGVPSVTQYIKDKKEVAAQKKNAPIAQKEKFKRLRSANDVQANPGNFKHSKKIPASAGFSLNDSLETTYQQAMQR
ncbi:hypothetical protein HUZ36_04490 [Pseudoalteromonas sp. McH1-7]|uniref:hypothetical protein n=1 Tax=Pseudoalteromonas sp. McH1-7 TaxID=2745574 RepID=UPI001591A97D|nr:hypothetical protein [Pseudoalteromonas sp. McH1-7]NUZ10031.1 hypothetical protein [Pseudoalteromonas sp. McH1-7]